MLHHFSVNNVVGRIRVAKLHEAESSSNAKPELEST